MWTSRTAAHGRYTFSSRKLLFNAIGFLMAVGALIATISMPTEGYAASAAIQAAKAKCIVGERNDGYLGVVAGKSADAALRREVAAVNQQRKAAYTRIAKQNGVSIRDTGRLTAEKLIAKAKSGECVQDASGSWIKKR
ncbi:MAG: YdbL family protein [Pseudomonadota bacterium]